MNNSANPPAYPDTYPEKSGGPPPQGYPSQGAPPGQPYPQQSYGQSYGQQPGVMYGAPPGAPPTVVYVQQPVPLTNPPNDYFCYSIFVTICCCFIIGIFAIMKSWECRTATTNGNRPVAEQKSQEARKLAHIALGVGIASIIICIIVIIVKIVMAVNFAKSNNYPY